MVRLSDGGDGAIRINAYDYAAWDLPTKISWLTGGAGPGGTAEAAGALSNLGDSLTQADTNLRQAAARAGIDWHGSAAEAAGAALTRAGQRSSDVGNAHTDGAMTVTEYGTSFGGVAAKVGSMQVPEYGFWDQVQDFFNLVDPQADYKEWKDAVARLNSEADTALKNHETTTRDAWNAIPTLAAAQPTTTGDQPAAGDRPDGGTAPVGRTGAATSGGPSGSGGPTGAAMPGGADPGSSGTGGGGTAAEAPTIPGNSDQGSNDASSGGAAGSAGPSVANPSIPNLPGSGQTSTAGYSPIQQLPNPSTTSPSPVSSPIGGSAQPGAVPIGANPFGPNTDEVTSLGNRRVSTGPEFAAKLPRSGFGGVPGIGPGEGPTSRGVPTEPAAAQAGRAGAAGAHGMAGTPMMGGAGQGRTDSTRQAKYVVPSSAAFEPPLPPHVVGVLGPEDEDDDYPY